MDIQSAFLNNPILNANPLGALTAFLQPAGQAILPGASAAKTDPEALSQALSQAGVTLPPGMSLTTPVDVGAALTGNSTAAPPASEGDQTAPLTGWDATVTPAPPQGQSTVGKIASALGAGAKLLQQPPPPKLGAPPSLNLPTLPHAEANLVSAPTGGNAVDLPSAPSLPSPPRASGGMSGANVQKLLEQLLPAAQARKALQLSQLLRKS